MNNTKYNQIVLEEVFNHGNSDTVECPECGALATYKDYDRNDGGSLNSYYSITCSTCDYHDCNDDFCCRCSSLSDFNDDKVHFQNCNLALELFFDAGAKANLSPVELTSLKLNYSALRDTEVGFPIPTLSEWINLELRTFLDRRFLTRLDQKIAIAKMD